MGISIRAYARHRGISETAVRKALKSGRITTEADGSIDPVKADRDWVRQSDPAQSPAQDHPHRPPHVAGENGLSVGGASFIQARTANEVLKAQTNKLRLAKLKSELI